VPTFLQIDKLSRSYGEKLLFQDISFVINQQQKVALIARNGAGKTTLLNIIAGLEPSDGGTVTLFNDISIEYLKQDPDLNDLNSVFDEVYSASNEIQKTILSYERAVLGENKKEIEHLTGRMDSLKAWEYETRIHQILSQLKIPDFNQRVGELSGGQRKRVALAKILISEPDFLILDEPTNHLDVEMIEWLEEFLSRPNITLLMVTHDRYFLDRVCDEIIELDQGSLYRYKGNYSYFLEKQEERIGILNKETEKARNLLRTEIEWMRRMPKARTTKSKSRIDSFYEISEKAGQKIRETKMSINIENPRLGKKILELHDVSFNWEGLQILKGFTYTFKRNEKAGIVGKNGSGKSTFLDIVTGHLRPAKGRVEAGGTISFGYYTQQGISFNEDTKVIDVVKEIADVVRMGNGETVSAAAFLNYFMFPYPSHYQPVYKLSGGEKRRLYLVTVLMQNPNFLILDEPTNDLDILTLNVLEEYLASFQGCILIVTHDRYFLDKIVDHLFVFEGDALIKDFPGNYTQYKIYADRRKKEAQMRSRPAVTKEETVKIINPNKLTFKEKRELENLEKEINSLENEKSSIIADLHSGTLSTEELNRKSERYAGLMAELESLSDRWLELSEKEY
jgi:ABC transport system ATP-binding/permease protein